MELPAEIIAAILASVVGWSGNRIVKRLDLIHSDLSDLKSRVVALETAGKFN